MKVPASELFFAFARKAAYVFPEVGADDIVLVMYINTWTNEGPTVDREYHPSSAVAALPGRRGGSISPSRSPELPP